MATVLLQLWAYDVFHVTTLLGKVGFASMAIFWLMCYNHSDVLFEYKPPVMYFITSGFRFKCCMITALVSHFFH